jgi:hypothetical protein
MHMGRKFLREALSEMAHISRVPTAVIAQAAISHRPDLYNCIELTVKGLLHWFWFATRAVAGDPGFQCAGDRGHLNRRIFVDCSIELPFSVMAEVP